MILSTAMLTDKLKDFATPFSTSLSDVKRLLNDRFDTIDFKNAKEDVKNFKKDKKSLEIWSADFFKAITAELK